MGAHVKFEYRMLFDAEEAVRDAAGPALQDVADVCLAEANETIPIEEGIMQDSGFTQLDEGDLVAQVAYSTPYVVKQHEDPTLQHDPGRRDHWLEQTVEENRTRYAQYVADEVRRRMG